MVDVNLEKKLVGEAAAELIQDGQVIGVGSGTTVSHFIKKLGERIRSENLKVKAVPSSYQSYFELIDNKIPLTSLDEYPELDITIDGADEVDPELNLIKGGGGALTQEKIIGTYTRELVIIVDSTKYVSQLGAFPVPVEVIGKALKPVTERLTQLGCEAKLRMAKKKMGPVVTDNGNLIVDCYFSEIKEPGKLEKQINMIPGVLENGLFVNLAKKVIIGEGEKVTVKKL